MQNEIKNFKDLNNNSNVVSNPSFSIKRNIQPAPKTKTISIDPKYKEIYYRPEQAVKESKDELQHQFVFWNHMMNVSMQNAIIQRTKAI